MAAAVLQAGIWMVCEVDPESVGSLTRVCMVVVGRCSAGKAR